MRIVPQKVLYLLFFFPYQYLCWTTVNVTVGLLFSGTNHDLDVFVLNHTLEFFANWQRKFESYVKEISNFDSLNASKTLCEMLNAGSGVTAVISLESSASPILESTCGRFDVPYIMTSWRPPNSKQADTVLNFFPKAELLAHAVAEVVKNLRWSSFVILYESEEGLIRLQEVLKLQDFKQNGGQNNILLKQLGRGPDHRPLLKEIKNSSFNNIILDCKTEHIIPILKQAKEQNLLNWHNNYFLTSLDAHTLDYTELDTVANITAVRLFDYNSEYFKFNLDVWRTARTLNSNSHISFENNKIKTETTLVFDAVIHIITAVDHLLILNRDVTKNPINCDERTKSKNGYGFANYMKEIKQGLTMSGPIKFDVDGNRIDFDLHVVDVLQNEIMADWHASTNSLEFHRDFSDIESAAVTDLRKVVVIVSSRIGEPYLMYREAEEGKVMHGNDRFEGYSMDLIQEIAKTVGFKFEFHLAGDQGYGRWDEKQKKWSGLIGDILNKRAHLAVADLTITHQRREVVDFSMPFMRLGISILHKQDEIMDINMFAFLDPFPLSVWVYIATLYLIFSVTLYFISRIVPEDWENSNPCEEDPKELENIWDIKNSLWLSLGAILTQGCDILPKGKSSRMALSMWWLFSLLVACSYTANLAAFLTKDRMEPIIDSAEALSEQTKIKYGLLDKSSTMDFFKYSNFPTYQMMWANMVSSKPSVFEGTVQEGVKRVQMSNGGYAFLMESTQIEYEIQTKCDLKQIGTFLGTRTYGIAMPLGAPYKSVINKAILKLQESGKLDDLKRKWWISKRKEPLCNLPYAEETPDSADLTGTNMHVIFAILGVGIGIAIILAISELLWNVKIISAEERLTYWQALKKELKIACNVLITKKRTKPVISEPPSSGSQTENNVDEG